jgi:hypothetical protein
MLRGMAGLPIPASLIAATICCGACRLDRELDVRRCHRRLAPRPVPSPHRARTGLLRRAHARHADQPDHRHLETRIFTLENMFVWNVLPPCVATFVANLFVVTVSVPMAATLMALAGILVLTMMRLAAAGRPLHTSSPIAPRPPSMARWST